MYQGRFSTHRPRQTKVGSLFVIARNSSFTYKGEPVDVRTVAKGLGVRYVLEGSIRRAANRIRVTAQLMLGFQRYPNTTGICHLLNNELGQWRDLAFDARCFQCLHAGISTTHPNHSPWIAAGCQ